MIGATKTIREVTQVLIDYRGKTPAKTTGGVKLITAKVIKGGFIVDGEHEYIAEADYDAWMRRGLPKRWDILITTEAPLGEVAQLRSPERVALAQRVILLRGDPAVIDQRFYFQALKSPVVQARLKARSSGTTVLGIKQSELWNVEIPYPPLTTQRRIADILSAYDDLIENNTRRIAILEEMARSLYQEWFVRFRYPGHEQAPLVDSPLGPIPEGWEVIPLFEAAEVTYGYPFKAKLFDDGKEGLPVVRIRDVSRGFSTTFTTERASEKYRLHNGDLLVGMDGEFYVGTWTGGIALLNQRVARLRPRLPISQKLLELAIRAPISRLQSAIVGTTVAHLGDRDLRSISLVLPPAKLRALADSVFTPSHRLAVNLRLKNERLRMTRDLLLPKLISGEIDVEQVERQPVEAVV